MPFVSFCLSTFKRGETLLNTLRSIQRQSFDDFEVIISDNDPDCSGRAYVDAVGDGRFRYFSNGANLGMKPSFNKSLERSSGEFIVMIADDDPVYPDMLETLVNLQKTYPDYNMYMGGCDWFCADREVAHMNNLRVGTNSCISNDHDLNDIRIYDTAAFITSMFRFQYFSHYLWSTCIVKRDLLVRMGGVPDFGTPFLGDFAYMSISSYGKGCVVINRSLGCQTIHKENFGRHQDEQLPVLAENFVPYLREKLASIVGWDLTEAVIVDFLGHWILGHMAFLYGYKRRNKLPLDALDAAEKKVFTHAFMKKHRLKYKLKKDHRALHDLLVRFKSALKSR